MLTQQALSRKSLANSGRTAQGHCETRAFQQQSFEAFQHGLNVVHSQASAATSMDDQNDNASHVNSLNRNGFARGLPEVQNANHQPLRTTLRGQ
jgi:hypothetical protein